MSERRRGIYILPSLFTSGNLFCGFFALVYASDRLVSTPRRLVWCGLVIIIAAMLDGLDGAVARRFQATSRLGMEYDSLADLVSFGVAPAITMYVWVLRDFGRLGVMVAFIYLACAALRLARFNVQADSVEKTNFQGLPSPMAAIVVASAVLIWGGQPVAKARFLFPGDVGVGLLALTCCLAALMVSAIPYGALKAAKLHMRWPFHAVIYVIVGLVVWAVKPLWVLFLVSGLYLLSGPVGQLLSRSQSQNGRQGRAEKPGRKARRGKDEILKATAEAAAPLAQNGVGGQASVHPLRKP